MDTCVICQAVGGEGSCFRSSLNCKHSSQFSKGNVIKHGSSLNTPPKPSGKFIKSAEFKSQRADFLVYIATDLTGLAFVGSGESMATQIASCDLGNASAHNTHAQSPVMLTQRFHYYIPSGGHRGGNYAFT